MLPDLCFHDGWQHCPECCRPERCLCCNADLFSPLGPTSAPRAGSSRGPAVADPAVATRTSPLLMQSDKNKRLTVFNTWSWVVCWSPFGCCCF